MMRVEDLLESEIEFDLSDFPGTAGDIESIQDFVDPIRHYMVPMAFAAIAETISMTLVRHYSKESVDSKSKCEVFVLVESVFVRVERFVV